jgi:hypothetical protein
VVRYYVQYNDPINETWVQDRYSFSYDLTVARLAFITYCRNADPKYNVRLVSIPEGSDLVFDVLEYKAARSKK